METQGPERLLPPNLSALLASPAPEGDAGQAAQASRLSLGGRPLEGFRPAFARPPLGQGIAMGVPVGSSWQEAQPGSGAFAPLPAPPQGTAMLPSAAGEFSLFGPPPGPLPSFFSMGGFSAAGVIGTMPPPSAQPSPLPLCWPAGAMEDSYLTACGFPTYSAFAEQHPAYRHPTIYTPPQCATPTAAGVPTPRASSGGGGDGGGSTQGAPPAPGHTALRSAFEPPWSDPAVGENRRYSLF
jgi:hypothetical protein